MRKAKLLTAMLFLVLVSETIDTPPMYARDLWTPARLINWFTERLPIRLTPYELACVVLLFASRATSPAVRPITRAMQVSVGALLFVTLYGLATGGVTAPIYTLSRSWVAGLIFGITAARVLTTVEDFDRIIQAVVGAALIRGALAIVYYFQVKDRPWNLLPATMTTHEDSVLFVAAAMALLSRVIELPNKANFRKLLWCSPVLLLAMQVNNRRLVWSGLLASVALAYFILPTTSKVARRINRAARILAPILIVYVAAGWGKSEGIFKPVGTLSSMMSSKKADGSIDLSTKARDNENLGLVTMITQRPILGTGFGHEWLELDKSGTVPLDVFPLYKFSPHNSALALFAFCGSLGLAGLWMVIPIATYLNVRTYRTSTRPLERTVVIVAISIVIAYLNQAFGDMGYIHFMPSTLVGLSIAIAVRMSVASGAWPTGGGARRNQPAPANRATR